MDYNQLDCGKLPIHPYSPTFTKWMEGNIPNIKKRDTGLNKACGYRFAMFMYDHRSPIHELVDLDWFGRKFEAAEAAGFELKKDKHGNLRFDDKVLDALIGKNEDFNDLIIDYVSSQNQQVWTELVYLQETVMRNIKDVLGGDRGDSATVKMVRDIYDRMEILRKKFTMGEEDSEDLKRRVYYRIEESRLAIRPEDYARRLAEGDDLSDDNPYGSNYIVSKLKFAGERIPDGKEQV